MHVMRRHDTKTLYLITAYDITRPSTKQPGNIFAKYKLWMSSDYLFNTNLCLKSDNFL